MKPEQNGTRDPVRLRGLPVLGICGCSGAGKTTLIEALVPLLRQQGLRIAVVKHDAHNVCIDRPGKDSDRLFRAGADVALFGEERFSRWHDGEGFVDFLVILCRRYDLVLVEGHARTAIPKIWLLGKGFGEPPPGRGEIRAVFSRPDSEPRMVLAWIMEWLTGLVRGTAPWGCVLIGGRSRRMGYPKHLIEQDGRTWLEATVARLQQVVDHVVLAGSGTVPAPLASLARIPDVPGLAGPMAGILAVMRWQPASSWLITACDQPDIRHDALQWLLEQRSPGTWAVLPDLEGKGRLEPLLAFYDRRCRRHLEALAATGELRISRLAGRHGVRTPRPPRHLHGAWRNVNTPAELGNVSADKPSFPGRHNNP